MMKKHNAAVVLIFSFLVVACSNGSSRYRDTAMLERPPTLALQQNTQNGNSIIDDSIEPKKKRPGLNSSVTLLEEDTKRVLIKQPITEAWRTLGMALKQSDIKITDYEKGKYNYYVNYHTQGVLTNIIYFLNEEESKTIYLLTLSSQGDDTLIQAQLANRNEQASHNTDGVVVKVNDDSDGLVDAIYHLLHDDIKTE
jgi:uncharacterized lipoprotein